MDSDDEQEDMGFSPDEAFGLLANEARMEILRLLWEEHKPYVESTLTFSELFDHVDYDDTGNFSYHLEKLVGTFVRRTDEGYELREAARRVLRSVHAGTVTEKPRFNADLGKSCPNCDGPIEARYVEDRLYILCSECDGVLPHEELPRGVIFAAKVPPAILDGRSPKEVLQAAITWNTSQYGAVTRGVCPECTGQLTRSLDICEDHPVESVPVCEACGSRFAVWIRHTCENCGYSRYFGLWPYAWKHPGVNAFYLSHDLDVNGLTWDEAVALIDSIEYEEILSVDPLRARQVISVDDDELEVTFNDDLDVVDIS
ncbi:MAG: helix-turn-helix domain-containing protein [Halobacteria archaeon]|nr:helix-turn-helix domain-containing protein [Halobacteria archaeon]